MAESREILGLYCEKGDQKMNEELQTRIEGGRQLLRIEQGKAARQGQVELGCGLEGKDGMEKEQRRRRQRLRKGRKSVDRCVCRCLQALQCITVGESSHCPSCPLQVFILF